MDWENQSEKKNPIQKIETHKLSKEKAIIEPFWN